MNNRISDTMILHIVDTFDEACQLYYQASIHEETDNTAVTNYDKEFGRLNYFICLMKAINVFLEQETWDVDEETEHQLDTLFLKLKAQIAIEGVNVEEIRRALVLLDINGFKNINFPLDLITPDAIGVLCARFIHHLFLKKSSLQLLDFNFGVGNLAFTIANHSEKEIQLTGIENHGLLAAIAACKANMMINELQIYHQDALEYLVEGIDVVVSDIATCDYENAMYHSELYDQGVRYFPYLAIEHYFKLHGDCSYIYIVDNHFFEQAGNQLFKNHIHKCGRIRAFIILPPNLFLQPECGKSILIMDKKSKDASPMAVFMLPSTNETDKLSQVLQAIDKELETEQPKD